MTGRASGRPATRRTKGTAHERHWARVRAVAAYQRIGWLARKRDRLRDSLAENHSPKANARAEQLRSRVLQKHDSPAWPTTAGRRRTGRAASSDAQPLPALHAHDVFTGVMQLMGLERVVRVGGVDGAHIQPLAASPLATTAANPNLFIVVAVLGVPSRANHHSGVDRGEQRANVGALVRLVSEVRGNEADGPTHSAGHFGFGRQI